MLLPQQLSQQDKRPRPLSLSFSYLKPFIQTLINVKDNSSHLCLCDLLALMPDVSEGLRQEERMWTAFLLLSSWSCSCLLSLLLLLLLNCWSEGATLCAFIGMAGEIGEVEGNSRILQYQETFFISINCAAPHGRDLNTQVSVMMILFWMQTLISKKSSNLPVDSYSQAWGGINIWSVACCFRMKSAYDLVKQLIWASWKSWKRK